MRVSSPATVDQLGFTLLELLAVVVLLSMVAGTVSVNLVAMSEASSFRTAVARLGDMDARARLRARLSQPVILSPSATGTSLILRDLANGETISQVDLPVGSRLLLETDPPRGVLIIDRNGRSPDYRIALTRGDRQAVLNISGSTGWVKLEESAR